jgi:hypothetical protein
VDLLIMTSASLKIDVPSNGALRMKIARCVDRGARRFIPEQSQDAGHACSRAGGNVFAHPAGPVRAGMRLIDTASGRAETGQRSR